jgi:hypothetical protein
MPVEIKKSVIYGRRRQVFVEWKDHIWAEIELDNASGTFHRILVKFNLISDGRDRNLTREYL